MTFRKFTRSEVNKAIADVYFAFAGGLNSLNHPMARPMAWSAFFFEKNLGLIGRSLFWLIDLRITGQVWEDLSIMAKHHRLDKFTGRSLISSRN